MTLTLALPLLQQAVSDTAGAYAVSLVLALIAVIVLVAMTVIRPRGEHR